MTWKRIAPLWETKGRRRRSRRRTRHQKKEGKRKSEGDGMMQNEGKKAFSRNNKAIRTFSEGEKPFLSPLDSFTWSWYVGIEHSSPLDPFFRTMLPDPWSAAPGQDSTRNVLILLRFKRVIVVVVPPVRSISPESASVFIAFRTNRCSSSRDSVSITSLLPLLCTSCFSMCSQIRLSGSSEFLLSLSLLIGTEIEFAVDTILLSAFDWFYWRLMKGFDDRRR